MLILLLACTCPSDSDDSPAPSDDSGTTTTDDSGSTDDSGTTTHPPGDGLCAEGMVPVPSESPTYCIDKYEVVVDDASGTCAPVEGGTPTTLHTYDDSVAICENTPVLDGEGNVVGYKRMATADEWEDAADGVIGDGGSAYPYGDEFDASKCATPLEDGTVVYDSVQPSGSLPGCVSAFGVYDQAGNAWEWADSGFRLDNTGWVSSRAAAGLEFSLDPDGVRLVSGELSEIYVLMFGVSDSAAHIADDGRIYLDEDQVQINDQTTPGYLTVVRQPTQQTDFLLVEVSQDPDTGVFYLLAVDEDGAPIPDKRGGAYYTGDGNSSRNDSRQLVHYHGFGGTIGFRCTSDPL